ncbi:MAG: hypothetical protein GY861_15915 [bacterium]|nr:hypothetical protein [bacterium]
MVFDPEKFSTLGAQTKRGSTYQLFGYFGDVDGLATISADGYFNVIKESLTRNDVITVLNKVETDSPKTTLSMYSLMITTLPLNGDITTTVLNTEPPNVSIRNDNCYVYICGDENTDGSIRFSTDSSFANAVFEIRIEGIWQPATMEFGTNSVFIGPRVGLSAIGNNLANEDTIPTSIQLFSHNIFDGETTTSDARILDAYDFTEREIFQSDESGLFSGTLLEFTITSPDSFISSLTYIKTGAVVSTSSFRIQVWRGTDDTGAIIYDREYPPIGFIPSSENELEIYGYLKLDKGLDYFFRVDSDDTFSIKMDTTNTVPWIAFDTSGVRDDDMLQTTEWVDGNTFTKGDWTIQDRKIYECNTTGTQSTSFASNSDLWNQLTANNFSYNEITSPKITIDAGQQMIVNDGIKIDGELIINGDLSLIAV